MIAAWEVMGEVTECTISGHIAVGSPQLGPVAYVDRQHVPLVRAAPELLEVARDLLAHLNVHLEEFRRAKEMLPGIGGDLSYIEGGMSDSLKSAVAVIAKAEGDTS